MHEHIRSKIWHLANMCKYFPPRTISVNVLINNAIIAIFKVNLSHFPSDSEVIKYQKFWRRKPPKFNLLLFPSDRRIQEQPFFSFCLQAAAIRKLLSFRVSGWSANGTALIVSHFSVFSVCETLMEPNQKMV